MSRAQRPGSAPRWPDLLIGLLVVLLLAGFAALLIGQGRGATTAEAPPPAVVEEVPEIPVAPGTDLALDPVEEPTPAPEATTTPEETEPATEATAPREETPPAPAEPEAATSTPSEPAEQPGEQAAEPTTPAPEASTARPPAAGTDPNVVAATPIPAAPPAPPVPEVTLPKPETTIPLNPPASASTPAPGTEAPEGTSPDEATETASTPAPPARPGSAVTPSEERTPLRSDYRISLGTFGSEAEARRAASGVSDAGYPVYVIDLGAQVVAQVGPYADETTARRALADIQPRAPRAVLYAPRGRNLSGGGSETTEAQAPAEAPTPAAPPEAVPAEPDTAPAAQAPAPSGPVYLQVGAFDRQESAGRLVGMLRDLGFSPTVNAPENRKVTVLVGPYSGDALLEAERKLDAGGHDHFRIR
ncbi:hypothetical protein F8S09_13925 [Deinococcus sp. SDU3-2]|uniref:SPOR domain-containing protein n=1 Tax=Deinococcus terrestris TaxID=2651870 RepID=A0A7X1TSF6_9DEIO|nr:SPOR domain-containing protein [Deinococcus terrestris]MPY67765.1 hypothetical protein [Deinococcus terrestris]